MPKLEKRFSEARPFSKEEEKIVKKEMVNLLLKKIKEMQLELTFLFSSYKELSLIENFKDLTIHYKESFDVNLNYLNNFFVRVLKSGDPATEFGKNEKKIAKAMINIDTIARALENRINAKKIFKMLSDASTLAGQINNNIFK